MISAVATKLLWDEGDHAIFTVFIGAVALSAWLGGMGPGLAATVLSETVTAFFLLPKPNSLAGVRDEVLRMLTFTFVALLTASLHAATRRAHAEHQRAREAAETASTQKDKFVAMVTHELRNPLNPVMLTVSLLESDPELPEKFREDLATIRRNLALEVRLIEDLLDLARCATGKLRLNMQRVDIREPLNAAIEVCQTELHAKQIGLQLDTGATEMTVYGDPHRLEQIFWNLLRNAIKFTPSGGRITVHASRSPMGAAQVQVSDTGIGISPDRLRMIFNAFEQGGPDIFARFGGLGLGLAISRAICETHGGSIAAASDGRDRGASFTVMLPIALPACRANDDGATGQAANGCCKDLSA